MADVLHGSDAPPPVPGFWRLGWLLFMQPLTLHRLFGDWGLENDPSLWELRGRLREGDSVAQALVARLGGWLLLVMPLSTVVVASILNLAGRPFDWLALAIGVAEGVGAGVVIGVVIGVAGGVASGVCLGTLESFALYSTEAARDVTPGVAADAAGGVAVGVASGVAVGLSLSVFISVRKGVPSSIIRNVVSGVAFGVVFGIAIIIMSSVADGIAFGITASITFPLAFYRLPLYPAELTLIAALRLIARLRPASLSRLASHLPYRYHELSSLPLPFLAGFLVRLGEEHPAEGRRALAEAAASLGQKRPAHRALTELQARSLERAARERQYASAAALSLPFLPGRESLHSSGYPRSEFELASAQLGLITINSIAAAAQDLVSVRSTGSYHQRRQALTRARKELERTLDLLTSTRLRDGRRFLLVVKAWLDRVADEEAALAALEKESPQVPLVFIAGVPITPADESLFVGRRDLVRLLDQDLAAERPVPLVLLGQRRMGKSTLLNFLPRLLGTGTRVVSLNFQGLSGNPLRGEPHCWVAAEVAKSLADASPPPEKASWGATLDWLSALEETLASSDLRMLIALDEVEGLERGIREEWSDPAFLDFLRAAGDRLRRIRFLLVTAHPFSRLGPHWSDRLISAQTRRIEPLAEEEARALLTRPVTGFPDIYPPGGVEHLLTETACHPYLLQLTAYLLTRRLNEAGRLKATDDDLTAALDQALEENTLFQYLWDDLSATEQRLMAALARGEEPTAAAGEAAETLSQARRELTREQLIQRSNEGEGWRVAVPLFARWIREIGSAE